MPIPFQVSYGDPTANAQRNLVGRTHYVDADTLRFHKARILSCVVGKDGLLLGLVESVVILPDGPQRGFRPVVFDMYGNVVNERRALDQCHSTRAKAEAALKADMVAIDADAVNRDAAARALRNQQRDLEECFELLQKIKARQLEAATV